MNVETFEFFDTADAICKRPKFYTLNGTFGEVIALLQGYAGKEHIFRDRGHHSLDPFQRFLSKQGKYESLAGFVSWSNFYKAYQDDETAISELRRLLKEFRGIVSEIEGIGIDIWLEEEDAMKVYSILDQIEFSEEEGVRKDAFLEMKENIAEKLNNLQLTKSLFYKTDEEE